MQSARMDNLGCRMMILGAAAQVKAGRPAVGRSEINVDSPDAGDRLLLRTMLFGLKKLIAFWLMPLPFCLAAMAVGLILWRWKKRERLGRRLLTGAVVLLMLYSNKLVSKWLISPLEARYPAMPEFV